MERASSSCIFMSAMRWRSAWKLLMATPNCLRVFMYSAVMATVLSITPTLRRSCGNADVDGVFRAARPSVVIRLAGAFTSCRSAARAPSCVP
jgi:hypothetical protein